jgi:hypothetical protein
MLATRRFEIELVLDQMKRIEQRFNIVLEESGNLSENNIVNKDQVNIGDIKHNSSKISPVPQKLPPLEMLQKESIISNLKSARFLDWNGYTWNNDIRELCNLQKIENGYKITQDIKSGYEYKMILFDEENINSAKMITSFTIEDGSVEIALRPHDLAPHGTVTSLGKGKYDIEFWIENGKAKITINGKPAEICHDDPANYGFYSIMTSRKCAIVFHELYFLRMEKNTSLINA